MTTDSTPPAGQPSAAVEQPEAELQEQPVHGPRKSSDLRRYLAWGTGVSIEIRDDELQVAIAKVRPGGAAIAGAATVTEFRTRPAAEWGSELLAFLRKLGARHIAATVLLPRRDVIVRELQLPGVSDKDLPSAIRLAIDSLHPFADDEVYFSWSRIGKTPLVLVGIARREVVDSWSSLLAEAGIKVAAFTFSAAVLYTAVRLITSPEPEGFVTAHASRDGVEIYGESPARPLYSATLPVGLERSAALARAELRLDSGAPAFGLHEVLPRPLVFPANYDPRSPEFERNALSWAAAIAGACPHLAIDGNLLPAERRRTSSRVRLIPTITLAVVLAGLLIALALQAKYADERYLSVLQGEIGRYEPRAQRVASVDKAIAATRARTQSLDEFRRRPRLDMDALGEITKLIPPPAWVTSLEMDRSTVQIGGEAEQAATLLQTLDASPFFERSEFTMPILRTGTTELFRVRVARQMAPVIPVLVPPAAVRAEVPPTSATTPAQAPAQTPAPVKPAPNPFAGPPGATK